MRRLIFQKWCSDVTSGIRTHPDREYACKELANHLEDKYQTLIAAGMEPQAAAELAVAQMGDPAEIAYQLNAAYPPLSGKLYTLTKRVFIFLLCLTSLFYLLFFTLTHYIFHTYTDFDPDDVRLGDNEVCLAQYDRGSHDFSDGYFLRVADAALWRAETINSNREVLTGYHLNVQVESITYLPWAEAPGFSQWMWAVDSLGNYYYSEQEDSMEQEPSIVAKDFHTGMFTYTHNLWLRPYASQDAQWIEIHYDRAGRDIVLHIDLTGGETP